MNCSAVPYEGKAPYIFLSYCHRDRERLLPLFESLTENGYRVWYDDGNRGGDDWLDNIENHLEDCQAMIAFITENSSLSHNCKSEIVYALKCRKKVIPILMGTTELPKGLRMQLSHLHYLSRADFDTDVQLMTKACKAPECQACRISAEPEHLQPQPVIPDPEPAANPQPETEASEQLSFLQKLSSQLFPARPRREQSVSLRLRLPSFLRKKKAKQPEKAVSQLLPISEEQPQPPAPPVEEKSIPDREPVKQLYISSESDKPPLPAPQPDNSNQLYVSGESSRPPMPVTQAPPERINPHHVGTEGALSTIAPTRAQAALSTASVDPVPVSHPLLEETPTVYDIRRPAPPVQNANTESTILIHNRVPSLLVHVRSGRAYILRKPQTKLGRSPIKCDVILDGNDSISKLHAELRCYNQKFFLADAGSKNGTYFRSQRLEPGVQVQLESPASFQLNDELMLLITGEQAKAAMATGYIPLLVNRDNSAALLLDREVTLLNRNHQWPDGTLNDPRIHRAAHARILRYQKGYYLVDESPENGNGTSVNQYTLRHGEARLLSGGDRIQLGDTALSFVTIRI